MRLGDLGEAYVAEMMGRTGLPLPVHPSARHHGFLRLELPHQPIRSAARVRMTDPMISGRFRAPDRVASTSAWRNQA
jgi:hypothetical protein